jgi:hypothetical protein
MIKLLPLKSDFAVLTTRAQFSAWEKERSLNVIARLKNLDCL